jgi:hypothetical protein
MAEASREAGRVALRWWRWWPGWIGYVAAAWSLAYGLLGLYWALGGASLPFGENDHGAALSVFGGAQAETTAPVIATLGLVGAVAAVATVRARRRRVLRVMLLGFAWGAAATLALVIPDYRVRVGASLRLAPRLQGSDAAKRPDDIVVITTHDPAISVRVRLPHPATPR